MHVSNLCAAATVAMVAMIVALPAVAHDGPEPHPTVEELEKVVSEIRSEIGDVEGRLGERIDDLEARLAEPDQQDIAAIIESQVGEALAEPVQAFDELKGWGNTAAAVGAALIAGLTVVCAILGFQIRALRRQLSGMSQPVVPEQKGSAETRDGSEQEEEERNEEEGRRIVTHTAKERIRPGMKPTVKELHKPDADWSPRTVAEAISDIDSGIQYFARGPKGNEAEIEVRQREGKRYLRTKPDEHGGNNLTELPDPP